MVVAGKTVVVVGYGWCGRGVAMRAAGLGARVIVTEVDPHKACEALMDGFDVMSMEEASRVGDIFLTLTGNIHVLRKEHFELMKNGAVLGNAGHFDVEISKPDLTALADHVEHLRDNIDAGGDHGQEVVGDTDRFAGNAAFGIDDVDLLLLKPWNRQS